MYFIVASQDQWTTGEFQKVIKHRLFSHSVNSITSYRSGHDRREDMVRYTFGG